VIEATVFRTISGPVPAWESLLPPELLRLPEELARVDALLDDPVFFAPFAPYFHPVPVRPTAPVECYLRLMYLKFRYRLGYESLCAEVSDSARSSRNHDREPTEVASQCKRQNGSTSDRERLLFGFGMPTFAFRPDISQVGADRARVMRCRRHCCYRAAAAVAVTLPGRAANHLDTGSSPLPWV
jgi:hypothetical protein